MFKPRAFLLLFLFLLSFAWLNSSGVLKKTKTTVKGDNSNEQLLSTRSFEKAREKANKAKSFVSENAYNNKFCLLVDMSLLSYQNRFLVYDLMKDTILNAGLVTHGRCNENWLKGRRYDNKAGCGCTSLGKYKVGFSYKGRFGLAYKLYGLDKTNDNAFKRFVVLHSHSCVPESEVDDDICQSDGCPTVSPSFLQYLKARLDASARPVLLWIYE